MKTCPFCAERIKDEAIVCRYCGRDLPKSSSSKQEVNTLSSIEPSTGINIVFSILLLSVLYGLALFIVLTWLGTDQDLINILVLYQLISSCLISGLALGNIPIEKRNLLTYSGIIIMSIIPVLSWVVIYWAGREIARSLPHQNRTIIAIVSFVCLIAIILIPLRSLAGFENLSAFFSNSTTLIIPTITPRPTATLVPGWWSDCIYGQAISPEEFDQYLNKSLCVYGTITKKNKFEGVGYMIDIFPHGTGIPFFIYADLSSLMAERSSVGDCLVAEGIGFRTDDGVPLVLVNRMLTINSLLLRSDDPSLPKCE